MSRGQEASRIIHSLVERTLNDATLGLLALLSLFLLVTPHIFDLSRAKLQILNTTEYVIILIFAIEYLFGFYFAKDKRAFLFNLWRIIDVLIIAVALVAILPMVPDVLRNSPALRLARLVRIALLGTRSGIGLKIQTDSRDARIESTDKEVRVFALDRISSQFNKITWEEGLSRINETTPDWVFVSGLSEERLSLISASMRIPELRLHGLFQSSVPRFDRLEHFTALFVRYPLSNNVDGFLSRTPVLLIGTPENVVVLSREHSELAARIGDRLETVDSKFPPMVRATIALVAEISRAYIEVVEQLESALITIEARQEELKEAIFLSRTFMLRGNILRVRSSLKHLKTVLRDLQAGAIEIGDSEMSRNKMFEMLEADVTDMYQDVEDLKDSLQSLVDLRLNVSSFQMNRVMRLLALLTALALIPATAGGLLGMNLTDTPWPGTLAQVSFGVAAGMALSLYLFAIKGWLR